MENHIKSYQIIIETIGPIFIGSGSSYGKKETIFDEFHNKVHVPNTSKMYQWMIRKNMQNKYQEFMLGFNGDFGKWLYHNGFKYQDYKEWIDYSLDARDAELDKREKKEISCFVKDAYGKPYIPGSSLKGALRTILLSKNILDNKNRDREYSVIGENITKEEYNSRNRKGYLAESSMRLETKAFRTNTKENTKPNDAVNDSLSGLRTSDSKPLEVKDLILCKKIDVNTNGESHSINILRECIRPKTKIVFDLTIDTTILGIDDISILDAVKSFIEHYNKSFAYRFKDGTNNKGNILYLGGGCGFVSKTILYPLLGDNALREVSRVLDASLPIKIKKQHGHINDIRVGASPHIIKKTLVNSELINMGACSINITPK